MGFLILGSIRPAGNRCHRPRNRREARGQSGAGARASSCGRSRCHETTNGKIVQTLAIRIPARRWDSDYQEGCVAGTVRILEEVGVAFRIGPEWMSICLNDFTRPAPVRKLHHCSGKVRHWAGKFGFDVEVLGTRRSQTLTDVPVAAWRSQAVWCGLPSSGLGVSAAADPPLPGELLASWIAALRAFQISRAKRPFSGAMAVGMARLGGLDPEIPVQNRTRQHPHFHGPGTNSHN